MIDLARKSTRHEKANSAQDKMICLERVIKFAHAGFEVERRLVFQRMFWPWGKMQAELEEKERLFSGLQLEVSRGETVSISGVENAGKTTLAMLIAGLAVPDGGRLTVRGRVAILPPRPVGLTPFMTFAQYVALQIECFGLNRDKRTDLISKLRANEVLAKCWQDRVVEVSKGAVRSVCTFIALYADQDIYLFDGSIPTDTGHLNLELSQMVERVISEKTVLILSRPDQIPLQRYNKAYFFYDGKLHLIELQNRKQRLHPVLPDVLSHSLFASPGKATWKELSGGGNTTAPMLTNCCNAVSIRDIKITSNGKTLNVTTDSKWRDAYCSSESMTIDALLRFDNTLCLPVILVMQLWSNGTLLYATRSPVISIDNRSSEAVVGVAFSPSTMQATKYSAVFFVSVFEDESWHLCDKAKFTFRTSLDNVVQEDDIPKRPIDLGVVNLKGIWKFNGY